MSLVVAATAERGPLRLQASFEAAPGETVALVGPNGAGKSTLLDVVMGVLPPSHGKIVLADEVLDDADQQLHRPPESRSIGVMFQDLLLFPHLSALDNVAFPLVAQGSSRATAREIAATLLDQLGVLPRAQARPSALSGGEAQRVALARALIGKPRLLLLDEPLSALDLASRGRIRALMGRVLGAFPGVTLLVTHDPVDAITLADRWIVLENGAVTQQGTLAELRRAPRSPFVAELVGLNVFIGRLEAMPDGAGRLVTAAGHIIVAWPAGVARETVEATATLRPNEVTLHVAPPEGSARNLLVGPIIAISRTRDLARVRLGSQPEIEAELTQDSALRMGLAEGQAVWASFKANAVEVAVN